MPNVYFVNLVQGFAERGMEQRVHHSPRTDLARRDRRSRPCHGEPLPAPLALGAFVDMAHAQHGAPLRKPDVIMAWMSRSSRLIPDYPSALKLTRLWRLSDGNLRHFRHNDRDRRQHARYRRGVSDPWMERRFARHLELSAGGRHKPRPAVQPRYAGGRIRRRRLRAFRPGARASICFSGPSRAFRALGSG